MAPTTNSLKLMVKNPDCLKVVNALFEAIAYQETVRDIIAPKQQEIIDFYKFPVAKTWKDHYKNRALSFEIIDNEKHMYLAEDEDFQIYLKEMYNFSISKGFKLPEIGFCPLLMAKSMVRNVKIEVCKFLEPWLCVTYDQISGSLDVYKKYFDLVLTMFAGPVKEYQKTNGIFKQTA